MAMQCNVGGGNKLFRIVVGLGLIALPLVVVLPEPWKIVAWVVAAIALVKAFVGFFPAE